MATHRKRGSGKWIVLLLMAGATAGAGYWFYKSRQTKPDEYQTAQVTRGEITQAVTASGQLNPVVNVEVGSQISGILQKIFVDFNSPVRSNQVIAQLDSATYQANVRSAEAELSNARAALELARVESERARALRQDNLLSPSEFDRTVATFTQAEAQVAIREASVERAKVDLSRCTIYAPVDGIVISRNVDVGQTVAASLSAPTLFIIANDLTKMQINANVAEADIGAVETGQDVEFTVDAYPNRMFHGKVIQIRNAPTTVQNVVTYDTVIEVNNPDMRLKPGMTANVSIVVARRENAVRLPNAALRFRMPETADSRTNAPASAAARSEGPGPSPGMGQRGQGGGGRRGGMGGGGGAGRMRQERQVVRTVYVLKPSADNTQPAKPEPVQIRTGITDGSTTEILEGLNDGDLVVTGIISADQPAGPAAPNNPFGGGGRGGFGRRL